MDFINRMLLFNNRKSKFGTIAELSNATTIFNYINSMFTFTGFSESVKVDFITYSSLVFGQYAYFVDKDGLGRILPCNFFGEPDTNGIYKNVIINAFDGTSYNKVDGEDCVVGYALSNRMYNWDLYYFTKLLTDADISLNLNTIYSRNKIYPLVKDSKDANKIDNALKDLEDGRVKTITLNTKLEDFVDNNKQMIETMELSKPEMMQYLTNLNKAYDDLLSRFLCKYGINTNYAGKMAQMTTDELQGYEQYSKVLPNDMLNAYKEFCKKVNKVYNLNTSVEFSDAFKHLDMSKKESFINETNERCDGENVDSQRTDNL